MIRRYPLRATKLICVLTAVMLSVAGAAEMLLANDSALPAGARPAGERTDELFGLTNVWKVHIEISAEEFDEMQPAQPAFGFPGGTPPSETSENDTRRDSETNLFGTEFPWASASITVNDRTIENVGVRYDGNISYTVSASRLKRPLKIDFQRSGQSLAGLATMQLNAMPLDSSNAREAIAFSVFREAEVPAPRTAFAEVTLTVPGRHDREYLGLYTVVEGVDSPMLVEHFGSHEGLLMAPFRLRDIEYLGEDWQQYTGFYRPRREATEQEAQRIIDFAQLVHHGSDEEFREQIDSFLDVDAFLRFLAANALTSNLETFFALGHNYHLYLDPQSSKLAFLPGNLEFSLANFLLMGSPEELMDLSITNPYPGENRLTDRLLSIEPVKQRYLEIVRQLTSTVFTIERLQQQIESIEQATQEVRTAETQAVTARGEPPAGFGPGAMGPQAPDLRTFARQRTASIAAQLAGSRDGYVPRPPQFGPPVGGGPPRPAGPQPIDQATFVQEVDAPPQLDITLFAAPPHVNSPVAIAAAPDGVIYVAVDQQGSLGRSAGGGRILRCVDHNGNGYVDEVTVFAEVEHPRGVFYRDGAVWVMHPPTLSVFHDDNGNGIADRQDVLVTGLTTDMIRIRGGDHTTNCVRMGIDGWLYLGVGDYGIEEARGVDGRTVVMRGGGVVRVRPDGTELEIYCTGLRNPFDIAIDPLLNLFTRDNTNDGGGWDTRLVQVFQTAEYGYTQLFANFTEETMPVPGSFGAGGGTGGMYIQDPRWPAPYDDALLTGDWGRSEVYWHELTRRGPTFDLKQERLLRIPRPTGMDFDVDGRLYVASWRGGEASVDVGPNVGFVARVTPEGWEPSAPLDLHAANTTELVELLAGPQSAMRLQVQGEILRRDRSREMTQALVDLAIDGSADLEGRVAAVFTLKQLDGRHAHPALRRLADDPDVRPFALRALTDRLSELEQQDVPLFVAALSDPSSRVRSQALIGLSRLNDVSVAEYILPLTSRPAGSESPTQQPVQNQPDPDRVIPHLAVRALIALGAIEACLEALDGPHRPGALMALRYMHDPQAVEGLIEKLRVTRDAELRRDILATLIRLYHREADYTGSWWGIRPDSTGPYYEPAEWSMSQRIGDVVTAAVLDVDPELAGELQYELLRHQVVLPDLPSITETDDTVAVEAEQPIAIPGVDPNDPHLIGNLPYEVVGQRTLAVQGDPTRGQTLFEQHACSACHTTADGQTPKGPHLVDIGQRSSPQELVESIVTPSVRITQGYETYLFHTVDGRVFTGFVVSESADAVLIREGDGVQRRLNREEIELREPQTRSVMPEGLVGNLTPEQLADLLAYLQSL